MRKGTDSYVVRQPVEDNAVVAGAQIAVLATLRRTKQPQDESVSPSRKAGESDAAQ